MTTAEIENKFQGELDAIMHFERLRWGDAIHCSYCNTTRVSQRQNDNRFHCSQCRKTFSVTTGTHLHSSKLPLKIWMRAFSLAVEKDCRIPIKELQSELKVSYTTAWRIRQGIKNIIPDGTIAVEGKEYMFDYLCRRAISEYKEELQQATV